jgi:hypothetical protein
MTAVATRAVLMLRLAVQTGQLCESVAARARGRARNAVWPMRAMAGGATRRECAVRRGGFCRVASSALNARGRARVRLMAVRADLVPNGRRGEFPSVTGFACGGDAARVRLMAAGTHLVPRPRLAEGIRVAGGARSANAARLVRQTDVATFARRVPYARCGQSQFLLMAIRARGVLRLRQLEVVRRVAALTGDAGVKIMLGRSDLMTTAATLRERVFLGSCRMRFMATDACAARDALRVIRMHVRVALRAGCSRIAPHVVRRVAARAQRVRGHESRGQHHHLGVARMAIDRPLRFELVGPVATDALRVTASEQCRYRDDRLSLAVTFGTRGEGIRGGRVLMGVARGARAVRSFAGRGVRGVDVQVAARASGGHRLLILMRAVAAQARAGSVHGNGRDLALGLAVAARAISRAVRFERAGIGCVRVALCARERVATHAIGVHAGAEALLCQPARVLDRRASGVALRAASRRNRAHRSSVQLMTLITRDVLFDYVHAVPGHAAIRAPIQLDVHAFARRPRSALVSALPRTADDRGEQEHADQQKDGEPNEAAQGPRIIRISNPTCECGI